MMSEPMLVLIQTHMDKHCIVTENSKLYGNYKLYYHYAVSIKDETPPDYLVLRGAQTAFITRENHL